MLLPLQQVALAPPQEIVQRRLRVYVDLDVVFVCPHLQADQQDPDVERSIELRRGGTCLSVNRFQEEDASKNGEIKTGLTLSM